MPSCPGALLVRVAVPVAHLAGRRRRATAVVLALCRKNIQYTSDFLRLERLNSYLSCIYVAFESHLPQDDGEGRRSCVSN